MTGRHRLETPKRFPWATTLVATYRAHVQRVRAQSLRRWWDGRTKALVAMVTVTMTVLFIAGFLGSVPIQGQPRAARDLLPSLDDDTLPEGLHPTFAPAPSSVSQPRFAPVAVEVTETSLREVLPRPAQVKEKIVRVQETTRQVSPPPRPRVQQPRPRPTPEPESPSDAGDSGSGDADRPRILERLTDRLKESLIRDRDRGDQPSEDSTDESEDRDEGEVARDRDDDREASDSGDDGDSASEGDAVRSGGAEDPDGG